VDDQNGARADTDVMTLTDYAIDIALIGLVFLQIRGRRLTLRSLILPIALVGIVANSYLHGIPTAGNDLVLVVAGAAAGVALGALTGAFTSVRQGADGHPVAKAGALAAGLWVLGVGTRFAFQLYTSHGGEGTISRFSAAHSITSGEAWVAALILMALSEVLARTLVLGLRAYAVAPSQFLARPTMIDAGDRVR
jgi:hypothetical protein